MRAIALAFAEARQAGDRFSLVVAGPSSGVVVGPDSFRHGSVAVALDRLLANTSVAEAHSTLAEALATAYQEACRRGDPEAALAAGAVVLVTGQPLGEDAAAVDLAHQGARAGIPLDVVGVSAGAPLVELDGLALAGNGSRRVLEKRADAGRLAEAELASAGDVVARAVRLRIRLAPGVRLVGIVGSRRLDEAQAERVREVERGVDLRLAETLGLASDRGEDEDGIQIVIPAFHAGDAHAILLDTVASGPGPIAEVSVRYKDLVLLRNNVARAALALPAGTAAPGPLERNVLRNLLAQELAETLTAAAAALDDGDVARASRLVKAAWDRHADLLARGPGWAADPEVEKDAAMLDQYARVLAGAASFPAQLPPLADSLRYAGRVKRLGRSDAVPAART